MYNYHFIEKLFLNFYYLFINFYSSLSPTFLNSFLLIILKLSGITSTKNYLKTLIH